MIDWYFLNIVTLQLAFPICYRSAFLTFRILSFVRSIFPHATFRILHVRDFPHFTGVHESSSYPPVFTAMAVALRTDTDTCNCQNSID